MNSIRSFALIVLTVVFWTTSIFANGILRVPHQFADDEFMNLKSIEATIEIHDQVAITTVEDVFMVTGDDRVDANFHFRLPPAASVTGFGYYRGDELIAYYLRPGEQGGPGGGSSGNNSLRNYLASNPFNIFISDIPPGPFKVRLEYAELLAYDFGVVSITYPFDLGDFLATSIDSASLEVIVNARRQLTEVTCSGEQSEQTHVEMPDQYSATGNMKIFNFRPRDDWQMSIRYNQEDIGGWLYTHRSDSTSPGYFMLVMEPGIVDPEEQVQKYFTFVFDRSGSMNGDKIVQARSAAIACINRIVDADRFNIIDFSTNVQSMYLNMVPGTAANRANARNYIGNIIANGSTNIYGALTQAVSQNMGEGSVNQVVFITDGWPTAGESTDADAIRQAVANANRYNARIFSFGIGQSLNAQLLNGLSFDNRGISYFINPQEERIDSTVAGFFRYIATPALGNPVVEFGEGLETDSLAPMELQDISAGRQLYLFGRYENFGEYEVALSGRMVDGDTTFTFANMDFPEWSEANAFVPRMWAKATIDEWIDWLDVHGEGGNQAVIDKIIELSLRFGILTRYTEFEEPPNAVEEPAIAMVSATPLSSGVELTWSAVGRTPGTVFNVYRSIGEGEFVKLNREPILSTSYFDPDINAGSHARYRVEMVIDNESLWSAIIEVGSLPTEISLQTPFPNPFNAITCISYSVPVTGVVELGIYNARGELVESLHTGLQEAGTHTLYWNAGASPAGIYLLKLNSGSVSKTEKLILLK